MKLLLRLSILIFTLFTGLYVVAMFSMDAMASPQMDMSLSGTSTPASCAALCVVNTHSTGTIAMPREAQVLLLTFVVLAVVLLILPLVRRIASAGLSYLPRPPDLITLYAHYRI